MSQIGLSQGSLKRCRYMYFHHESLAQPNFFFFPVQDLRFGQLRLDDSNVQEQCWVWPNEGQEYFYDKHEWVRFRVEQEQWHDASPLSPSERQKIPLGEWKSPYSLTVSVHTLSSATSGNDNRPL